MVFGVTARRSVHNHAIHRTAELPGSTWFGTKCYAGTLPSLSFPHGIE